MLLHHDVCLTKLSCIIWQAPTCYTRLIEQHDVIGKPCSCHAMIAKCEKHTVWVAAIAMASSSHTD